MQGVLIPLSLVPGNSFLHRLNPLPKLVWALGVLLLSFATRNPAILGFTFLLGIGLVLWAGAGVLRSYLRVVLILFPLALALIVLQSIAPAFPKPWTPIVGLGPFTIYQEGIYSGVTMLLRIMAMTTFALVTVMTSHPGDIFTSLQRVGMPYVMNFILTMTLQLIPILQNEFRIVLNAQKARGMRGTGFGALLPSMVPVFVGAIERVQQLSISLESRAFGSTGHKTSYRHVTMSSKDYLVLLLGVAASVGSIAWVLLDGSLDWSRTMTFPPTFAILLVVGAALGSLTYSIVAIRLVVTA